MLDKEAPLVSQAAGAFVAAGNAERLASEVAELARQDTAFTDAVTQIERVRTFLSTPNNILGGAGQKHGEIAEQVEVGVRNAWDLLNQRELSAAIDHVGRTAPEDYFINGAAVQSKFINGVPKTLDHVLDHMREYKTFGRDGSYYHIPRDQHEIIDKIMRGETPDGLSSRSIHAISEKLEQIRELSGGKELSDVVKPGVSTYGEVQQGQVDKTLDGHERQLGEENQQKLRQIKEDNQPGIYDALGAVGKGALVGATVRLTMATYSRVREGKNPFKGEFTSEDWKEIGIEAGEGGVQGAIAAGGIYALTNYADMAAPFAGAIVSSAMAVGSLAKQYQSGEISFDEFVTLGQVACAEGAIVGLATAAGQTFIPVPVLGAVVGAAAGRLLVSLAKDHLGEQSAELAKRLREEHEAVLSRLDEAYQRFVRDMMAHYDRLGELTEAAFSIDLNVQLRLAASVRLAQAHGVPTSEILHTTEDLDTFMAL